MIRVSLYDDNDSLRDTLALILDATDDLIPVGVYAHALQVVETVQANQPDVILMEIDMPGRTVIEAVRLLADLPRCPEVPFLRIPTPCLLPCRQGLSGICSRKPPATKSKRPSGMSWLGEPL